jgi:prephenate dehydrogenase
MAGSHARGIEAVDPKLYDRGFAFIIRDVKASKTAYACVKAFWALVMPRIVEISAQEHDRFTAEISHMPHALAVCLMQSAETSALRYAASGFRDMTRLAAGSAEIWQPIFEANRVYTDQSLTRLVRQIRRFQKLLKSQSSKVLQGFLQEAELKRKQL